MPRISHQGQAPCTMHISGQLMTSTRPCSAGLHPAELLRAAVVLTPLTSTLTPISQDPRMTLIHMYQSCHAANQTPTC